MAEKFSEAVEQRLIDAAKIADTAFILHEIEEVQRETKEAVGAHRCLPNRPVASIREEAQPNSDVITVGAEGMT